MTKGINAGGITAYRLSYATFVFLTSLIFWSQSRLGQVFQKLTMQICEAWFLSPTSNVKACKIVFIKQKADNMLFTVRETGFDCTMCGTVQIYNVPISFEMAATNIFPVKT